MLLAFAANIGRVYGPTASVSQLPEDSSAAASGVPLGIPRARPTTSYRGPQALDRSERRHGAAHGPVVARDCNRAAGPSSTLHNFGERLGQLRDVATQLVVANLGKGLQHLHRIRCDQEIGDDLSVDRAVAAGCRGVEQAADRDFKSFCDFRQAAGPDPIGALLVLLNLLEGNSDRAAQPSLR